MELWDGYFKDGTKANVTLIRGNAIPKGIFHLVCEVLVRHADGTFLLMQRAMSKKTYPGYFESTAGGSALKGEDKITCAKRELKEETGITADKLEQIACVVDESTRSIYYEFLCETDCDKSAVTLQEGETSDYVWVDANGLKEYIKNGKLCPGNVKRLSRYFAALGII